MLHPSLVLRPRRWEQFRRKMSVPAWHKTTRSSCHGFGECLGPTKHAKQKSSCFQDLSSLRFDEEESVSNFDRKMKKKLCPILFSQQVKVKSASGAP